MADDLKHQTTTSQILRGHWIKFALGTIAAP
jgi:hypothetical protein